MNDITALAQRMKAAAEKATRGDWTVQFGDEIYAVDGVNNDQVAVATFDANDADHIALSNPVNVLALVEALESGYTENERMARDLISRNGEIEGLRKRVEELEEVATDYGMKFQRAQDDLKKMALMHSDESCPVTVKLPDERFRYGESDYDDGYVNGWNAHGIEVKRLLADAGIQVIEGEGQ